VGAVGDALHLICERDIFGHEDVGFNAGGCGVGGDGSTGVACGGDGDFLDAVVAGHGDGEGQAAGLEGAGGVGAFLLEEDVRVAAAGEHGGPALAEGYGVDRRKNGLVAPHAGPGFIGARGADGVASGEALGGGEVVADVECAGAGGADGLGGGGVDVGVAAGAFEVRDSGHRL
jgi:hypothetical protein